MCKLEEAKTALKAALEQEQELVREHQNGRFTFDAYCDLSSQASAAIRRAENNLYVAELLSKATLTSKEEDEWYVDF